MDRYAQRVRQTLPMNIALAPLSALRNPHSATRRAGTPPGRLVRAGLANGRMVMRPSDLEIASQWSEWVERHGRYRREVAVERCGSSGDTIRNSAPVRSSAENPTQLSATFA